MRVGASFTAKGSATKGSATSKGSATKGSATSKGFGSATSKGFATIADSNARPKKPMNPFFLFREKVRKDYKPSEAVKEAANKWNSMTDIEKAHFRASAAKGSAEYKESMDVYDKKLEHMHDQFEKLYEPEYEGLDPEADEIVGSSSTTHQVNTSIQRPTDVFRTEVSQFISWF